ncbi:hypothetical protein RRG08_035338 [Elysia crispata]|uniref:Uncharacterized protein n=1 Tax=Elysia crispata TaxID=231223 RepID=A0AAE0Y3K2_9GAST|nr:hypothetical protein RRG08_035338 [Elysia crispata]
MANRQVLAQLAADIEAAASCMRTYAAYVQCRTDVREALAFPNPGPGNYQYFESPQFQHCLAERGRMLCGKAAETFVNSAVEIARSSPAGREVIAEVFSE